MAWNLSIGPPGGAKQEFADVAIDCLVGLDANDTSFDILMAHDRSNGQFLGGIALHHALEFMPDKLDARGFSLDEDRKLVKPEARQFWELRLEVESIKLDPKGVLALDFAEFFGAIQYISGNTDEQMSEPLGVRPYTFKKWVNDDNSPWKGYDERIAEVFELSEDEVQAMRANSKKKHPTRTGSLRRS